MSLELQPGQHYFEFEILEKLGSGGFGNVYKVRHPRYTVPLALKLSHDPVSAPETAQRALREVAVLRRYDNPYTVVVLDCGLNPDDHVYVLMEWLNGRSLDGFHPFDHKLDPRWVVHLAYQVCLALRAAHASGVVHRDLKPANVFVDPQGYVKVLDFGLARSWDESQIEGRNATVGHMLVGTPHYSQPEQRLSSKLTPAADVYSLGTIMYEMLSGHTPFVPDKPVSVVVKEWYEHPIEWIKAHAATPVVPLRRHLSPAEVSDELVHVVEQCLSKDPEQRPQHAEALGHMLRQLMPR